MYNLLIKDINIGFSDAMGLIKREGREEPSRNGPVLRLPAPILIEHKNPLNRFLLSQCRDANPFFHIMESLWMLEGDNDLEPLLIYNPRMAEYSDDGTTLRGTAYGHRWRKHFGFDQLEKIIEGLKKDPTSRRYVMSMWDPLTDLVQAEVSKDLACNLQVIFSPNGDKLDMTVTNRSNDLIYGCLGSNVFHFSMLLEYVAHRTGMKVGSYYQFSTNLHLYTENPVAKRCLDSADVFIPAVSDEHYTQPWFDRHPMDYDLDVQKLKNSYRTFKGIDHGPPPVDPGAKAVFRIGLLKAAIANLDGVKHKPTKLATQLWLSRRLEKAEKNLKHEVV